jgi:hypothetical protein
VQEVPPAKTRGMKKKTHRGTRSKKAKDRRSEKYVASGGPQRARKVIEGLTGGHYLSPGGRDSD